MSSKLLCPFHDECEIGINFCNTCTYGSRLAILEKYQSENNIIFTPKEIEIIVNSKSRIEKMKGELK